MEPMRIRNAIEVIKMLGPLAPELTQETKIIDIMKTLIRRINKEYPPAAIRLLALLENKTADEVTAELAKNMDARELHNRLVEGFVRNDLKFIMDFASVLGLSEARWEDDRSTV